METVAYATIMQEAVVFNDLWVLTLEDSKKNEQSRLEAIKWN